MLLLISSTLIRYDGRSAVDHPLRAFGVARPVHRDLGGGALDLSKLVGREFDGGRAHVLLQALQLPGAGDGNDPRLLDQ